MSSWLWLGSAFGVVAFVCFLVFPLPPLRIQGSRSLSSIVSFHWTHCSVWQVLDLGSGMVGGARDRVAGRASLWGVPPTWVWVVGFSPQILEHLTSICNTDFNWRKQEWLKFFFFNHSYLLKYVYSMGLFFICRRNLPKHVLSFCDAVVPIYWVCPWTKNFQRVFSYHRKQLLLCFPVCSHFWGKYDKRWCNLH